jgi:hypothetical protein
MAVSIQALRALAAAGATVEVIITAVETELAAAAEKRRKDAARQRKYRASKKSHGHRVTSRDMANAPQPIAADTKPGAQHIVDSPKQKTPGSTQSEPKIPLSKERTLFSGKEEEDYPGITCARARPACRLPRDWMPTLDDLAFARTLLRHERVEIEVAKFRDYWLARDGPNAVKRDWSATWRNWCRRDAERNGAVPPPIAAVAHGARAHDGRYYARFGSAQWQAWAAHRGCDPPTDKTGGWWFESEWPPGHPHAGVVEQKPPDRQLAFGPVEVKFTG